MNYQIGTPLRVAKVLLERVGVGAGEELSSLPAAACAPGTLQRAVSGQDSWPSRPTSSAALNEASSGRPSD